MICETAVGNMAWKPWKYPRNAESIVTNKIAGEIQTNG